MIRHSSYCLFRTLSCLPFTNKLSLHKPLTKYRQYLIQSVKIIITDYVKGQ